MFIISMKLKNVGTSKNWKDTETDAKIWTMFAMDIDFKVTDAHMVITFSKNRKHACPPNSSSAKFIWPFTSVHIRFEVNDSKSRFYEIIQIASEIISRWKYRFLTSVSCTNGVNGEIFGHLVVLTRKIKFQLRTHVL